MFLVVSHRRRVTRPTPPVARPRRGIALAFVMVFVIAMAALAMSAIFMASSSTLLAKSYDRERDLRYAAEAALAIGKAKVNGNPSLLIMPVDTNNRRIMADLPLTGANDTALAGIKVNVYVGLSGSTSGQTGRFASIIAQAVDERTKSAFIRRLELTQESFAKFAYWSNRESNSGTTIYFNNGDELWGPVWSNDVINIGSNGATFHDLVSTARNINGKPYGTFSKTPLEGQPRINLPATTALTSLSGYAAYSGLSFTSADGPSNVEQNVRDRIEFVAFDINRVPGQQSGDSTGTDEGFFRVFQGSAGNETAVRGDWPTTVDANGNPTDVPDPIEVTRCGDWHWVPKRRDANGNYTIDTELKFFPASVHGQTWFRDLMMNGLITTRGVASSTARSQADAEMALGTRAILEHANARCYLAGDPHLVAAERVSGWARGAPLNGTYADADVRKGGDDTTFTPVSRYGRWIAPATTPADTVLRARPADGRYLFSIGRTYNNNAKGVIYFSGNVGVSGVVNGLVTLYAKGDIVLLDDLRYANDPVTGVCHDIVGLLSDYDVVIADNAINTPVGLSTDRTQDYRYRSMDETKDLFIHGVAMALGTSFRAEDYNRGPTRTNGCEGEQTGRGCIYLSGGIIQEARGPVALSNGTGFVKRYTYDHCAVRNPPPYFPTTGRFQDNRYLELDPVGFNATQYFTTLTPNTP